jgi:hypothetical protein
MAATSRAHEYTTGFVAAAVGAGRRPSTMLFPLVAGSRNFGLLSSVMAKNETSYCQKFKRFKQITAVYTPGF